MYVELHIIKDREGWYCARWESSGAIAYARFEAPSITSLLELLDDYLRRHEAGIGAPRESLPPVLDETCVQCGACGNPVVGDLCHCPPTGADP